MLEIRQYIQRYTKLISVFSLTAVNISKNHVSLPCGMRRFVYMCLNFNQFFSKGDAKTRPLIKQKQSLQITHIPLIIPTKIGNVRINVALWRICVTIVAMDTQQYVLSILLRSCRCQKYKANRRCKKKKMLLWRIYVATNNKPYLDLHVKFHIFLSDSNQISTLPILNFMEICPAVSVLVHADGQTDERTDMTKLIGAFRDYVNAPKNTRHKTVTFKMFIRVPTKETETNNKL